jgi:hypothetical protein
MVRAGPQLRARLAGDETINLGVNLELSVGTVPYQRTIRDTTVATLLTGPDVRRELLDRDIEWRQDNETIWFWRTGVFTNISPFHGLTLSVGALFQNHPVYFDSMQDSYSCTYYSDGIGGTCPIPDADDIDPSESELVSTVHSSLAVELDPVVLVGQVYSHVSAPGFVEGTTPYGGEVAVRLVF